jgi:hypothetical protein
LGRAIAQAVSRWPLTAEARVRARVDPCGICGGQSGIGQVFSEYFGFPCKYIIQPLLHIHLSPPHEVCYCSDQAAHYHNLGPQLGASLLTRHIGWKQKKKVKKKFLRHGADSFTFPPKEGVLRIFIALKNPSPSAGLNSRSVFPMASTLTTRPPRMTYQLLTGSNEK